MEKITFEGVKEAYEQYHARMQHQIVESILSEVYQAAQRGNTFYRGEKACMFGSPRYKAFESLVDLGFIVAGYPIPEDEDTDPDGNMDMRYFRVSGWAKE